MNSYDELKAKHQLETNEFPFAFYFSPEQFVEAMKKLGLEPTDIDKVFRLGRTGGIYRRSDAARLEKLFARHKIEMDAAIDADKTGKGFIYEMFVSELNAHEYVITQSVDEALDALGLSQEDVKKDSRLACGLKKACEDVWQKQCN